MLIFFNFTGNLKWQCPEKNFKKLHSCMKRWAMGIVKKSFQHYNFLNVIFQNNSFLYENNEKFRNCFVLQNTFSNTDAYFWVMHTDSVWKGLDPKYWFTVQYIIISHYCVDLFKCIWGSMLYMYNVLYITKFADFLFCCLFESMKKS